MRQDDVQAILARAEMLESSLSSRPQEQAFVHDLRILLEGVIPVFAEVQASIASTAEALPHASRQLDKVNAAHELASTEILDIAERIVSRIEGLLKNTRDMQHHADAMQTIIGRLTAARPADPDIALLAATWNGGAHVNGGTSTEELRRSLESTREDCTSIMIALQVQDITGQQIAAVNKLMRSVDEGLAGLLAHIRGEADPRPDHHGSDEPLAFDPAAEYTGAAERQRLADSVIRNHAALHGSDQHPHDQSSISTSKAGAAHGR